MGPGAVLLKGGHVGRGGIQDHLVGPAGHRVFGHPRLAVEGHGTGCTLSAAIAANLALGHPLEAAVEAAIDYVHRALVASYRPGKGSVSVLGHIDAATGGGTRRG
jgi:hydroxymethylpyrimidine/phosphomethylpyrimidine kinase